MENNRHQRPSRPPQVLRIPALMADHHQPRRSRPTLRAGGHRFDPGWLHSTALQIDVFGDGTRGRDEVGTKQDARPGRAERISRYVFSDSPGAGDRQARLIIARRWEALRATRAGHRHEHEIGCPAVTDLRRAGRFSLRVGHVEAIARRLRRPKRVARPLPPNQDQGDERDRNWLYAPHGPLGGNHAPFAPQPPALLSQLGSLPWHGRGLGAILSRPRTPRRGRRGEQRDELLLRPA